MKKRILILGFFLVLTFGISKVADAGDSSFACIRIITYCGHPAVACGSSAEQMVNMVILANNYYCNP